MSFPFKILLGAGALALSSGAALAATATATTSLNVRTGPGTSYGVVDTLRPGETVRLIGCSGSWCELSLGGQTGFASSSYLDVSGRAASTRVIVEDDGPDVVAGLTIGGYWEGRPYYARGGRYYYGGSWYDARPGRAGWERRVIREERRDARREWRQERREDAREARRDWREDRRERIEDRREMRRDARQDARRDMRQERRQDARQERRQEMRQDARREARQEMRQERRERRGRDG